MIIWSLVLASVEPVVAKAFVNTTSAVPLRWSARKHSRLTNAGLFRRAFCEKKETNLKKLQEVDERWFDAHKIEARLGTVVTQFNIERRLAVLANGETIEFTKVMSGDGQPAGAAGSGGDKSWQCDLFADL